MMTGLLLVSSRAAAQGPPPRIGPLVFDLRGSFPALSTDAALAASRDLTSSELPGRGLGVDVNAHFYPLAIGPTTIGLGGQLTWIRARSTPASLRAVTERLTSLAPQLSLNFGTGNGWSYLSGGIGGSRWSIVPDDGMAQVADQTWVRTFNYGGGARWFVRPRAAFHIDVRVHSVNPGPAQLVLPGSPRTNLLIIGAGISLKIGPFSRQPSLNIRAVPHVRVR